MKRIRIAVLLFGVVTLTGVSAQEKPAPSSTPQKTATSKQEETKKEEKPVTLDAPVDIQSKVDNLILLEKTINMLKADNGIDKLEVSLQKKLKEITLSIPVGYHYDPPTRKFVLDVTPEVKK